MLICALSIAIAPFSIALLDTEEKTYQEYQFSHSLEQLSDEITRLCASMGKSLTDIDGIGVTVGPGNYTSLRLGVTVAKTIALHQNTPIWGFPTLDVMAHSIGRRDALVLCRIPSRKKEWNIQLFNCKSDPKPMSPWFTITEAKLEEKLRAFQRPITCVTLGIETPSIAPHLSCEGKSLAKTLIRWVEEGISEGKEGALKSVQPVYAYAP